MHKRILLVTTLLAALNNLAAWAQGPPPGSIWLPRDLGAGGTSLGVRDLDMPAANVVWGVNYDGTTARAPNQDIFVTTNGGTSFLVNSIVTPNSAGKDLSNVSAINGSTAFFGAYGANGGGFVFKTTDGGNTFTEASLPNLEFLNFVHFFTDSTGMLMSDPTQPAGTNFEIFRTTDAGTTWLQVPLGNVPTTSNGDFGLVNQFAAVGDDIWYGTFKGNVYHSNDRGENWTKASTGITQTGQAAALRTIVFSDILHGLVVSADGLITKTTSDGGATWTQITPTGPFHYDEITRVPGLPNTYVGVTVNAAAPVGLGSSVSRDNGLSWTKLDSGNAQYTTVAFNSPANGWAGGFTDRAVSTTGGIYEFTGQLAPTGTGTLTLNGGPLSLGTVNVGSSSTATFTVTNSGSGALDLLRFTGDGAFTVSPNTPTTLAPGASLTLTVTFTPTAGGPQTGTISVISNGTGTATATITVNGIGVAAPAPIVGLSATTVALGNVEVNTSVTGTFYVRNTGNAPLTISGITSSSPRVTVTPTTGTVAAGDSLLITATFTPTQLILTLAMITVSTNDPNRATATMTISGTGVQPTGLANDALSASVQLFPLPVRAGSPAALRLTGGLTLTGAPALITDALGRQVLTLPTTAGATELSVRTVSLRAGLYTVQVRTSRGLVARQLVVE